jgi:hypothetical protein
MIYLITALSKMIEYSTLLQYCSIPRRVASVVRHNNTTDALRTLQYIMKYPQTYHQIQYTSKPILAACTEKERVVINLRVSTCEERVRFASILFCTEVRFARGAYYAFFFGWVISLSLMYKLRSAIALISACVVNTLDGLVTLRLISIGRTC